MNVQADEPAKPSGVVTFLFTDIEGSTRRWEADPELMRSALEGHDAVLRGAIEKFTGLLFKHTGDGVCAVFASPRAAVDAAVAAQRSLELPVRMGIATGEAELRGGDYFGVVLNRAARVMSAGHGGQVLLDGQTAGLLTGVEVDDLGSRRLRDLTRPVELFQVRASGLQTEFPALKTLDPMPGNLRSATTSFIGRERELVEVDGALRAHRLVTLTGVGGVGKTRLALEVAARAVSSFRDGTWVVELAAVADPAAVPEVIASVLGITQQPGLSLTDTIASALEGRSRLLVLDNCEHLVDAVANLAEAILGRSRTVKVLATSREGLRVADEQLIPIPALDLDAGVDSTAVALFLERARGVASGAALTTVDEVSAAVEICRRLDGIPLAIELAASRMQSMTAVEIRDRLHDRFRLLVGSRRGLERHQTLRHAVQWSYDLLSDGEKRLLARCSVFAGGFDLAGACAVDGAEDEFSILDLLDALVRKSLLVADRSSGRVRFSMLETIRQFAKVLLAQHGWDVDVGTAHARYFAGRETDVLATWDSPHQRDAYAWFDIELANLRTAFRWATDHDDLDDAAAIAVYAAFLGSWVEQYEPVGWAEELTIHAKVAGHPRLAQLYVMASMCFSAGRAEEALRYADAARQAIDSGRCDAVPFEFEAALNGAYLTIGRPELAVTLCRNMIERGVGPQTWTRCCLVFALTIAGAQDDAIVESEPLLTASDDNPVMKAMALMAYGYARSATDPVLAYEVQLRGLELAQESGNREAVTLHAANLSRLASAIGKPAAAFDYLILGIRNHYDAGSTSLMRQPLAVLVAVFDKLGHYEPAATISGFASEPLTRAANPVINGAITHLREVLGESVYESFARTGATMTNADMVAYAFEQIDLARAEHE